MLCLFITSCNTSVEQTKTIDVSNIDELNQAIENCKAGDEIVLADGIWKDAKIEFKGKGTKQKPIVLRAQTPGKVFIEGESYLRLGGDYLEVRNLYFRNGYTPRNTVIDFRIDKKTFANHCKITHCVIEDFTQPDRDRTDHWVEFWGRHNELSNCYIAGKSNFGPTVMVMLKGNEHIKNYHQIVNNHFGPRPRKGGPHGETMQIGDSGTSMTPSHTHVANNFFERCNGEVEIISSKSNYNEFRNNVFFESEGSLVLRHGNYATIDGNVFIGNDNSEFIGGIRVINTGHWITNNYFYKLKGSIFRAPLAVMNGIPKSPQNRYNQVTDAVIAHNTYIDCKTPFHFGVGSNVSQKDVLPASEIRSAQPIRTTVANNLIFSSEGDAYPIKNYDRVDGVLFKNNMTNSENNGDVKPDGLMTKTFEVNNVSDLLYVPAKNHEDVFAGFDFETITTDLFGNKRASNNSIGAITLPLKKNPLLIDKSLYGTDWFSAEKPKYEAKTIKVAGVKALTEALKSANSGDILALQSGTYAIASSMVIDKRITITSQDKTNKATLEFSSSSPAFEMNPSANLVIEDVILNGNKSQDAFATLDKNMTKAYNLWIENSEISNFKNVLRVSKGSFADTVSVSNSIIKDCINGIQLNKETNDKGDYNAEFVYITNSEFNNVGNNVLNYYRGGYDESTIGGNLVLQHNTFTNCGKTDQDHILINNRGIVNVNFSNNTFKNNPVKLIAVLWGEKGQKPVDNTLVNSGKIEVVQNLKLKLMY
ncbi:alginate lyase [Flavivirga eckloniae]|uniref:Alginate lyase n=2 Tax=Flavivirga eckloniae TaxID=1803846 RepID=A0A2K9PWY6_9FLAO|nr:alginate lyase [Flavivirga eckloniae]